MFFDLAQTTQALAQRDLQRGIIGSWKLRTQSITHHPERAFKQLDGCVDTLARSQRPRPPHLVGVDRISQGFDVSFVHASKLAAAVELIQHSFGPISVSASFLNPICNLTPRDGDSFAEPTFTVT